MAAKFSKSLLSSILALGLALTLASPLVAQTGPITAQEDGANRVNVSGRQRMLSQRMAKAACFISVGHKPESYADMLQAARNDFSTALFGLRFGNDSLRLLRPGNPTVERVFTPVVETWGPFSEAVDQLVADPTNQDAIAHIAKSNVQLLKFSNDAVTLMADVYGGSAISPEVANTINVAGRQRMLSQRMGKGFCELLKDPSNSDAQLEFVAALDLFRKSHYALMSGDAGMNIIAPPTAELRLQLVLVDEAWSVIQTDLELAAAGVPPSPDAVDRVGQYSQILLVEMHKAVGLYGVAAESGS